MERIIDGRLYEGKRVPHAWEVRIWEQGGHREISASNVIEWTEVGAATPYDPWDEFPDGDYFARKDEIAKLLAREKADAEERRVANLKRNANRAKTACRRVIKAEGFDELLTLTYRENQQDRALCKEHFKEWVRRMKRHLGGVFRFCASFEKQDRGAMHVHLAVHKLPKHAIHKGTKIEGWRLGTAVWRTVVGEDNGLCFVGGKNRKGNQKRKPVGCAKMAAYVSKYITKDYADAEAASNRYSRSNGMPVGKPRVMVFDRATLAEIIGLAFTCEDGDVVISHSASEQFGRYWLCTENPAKRRVLEEVNEATMVDAAAQRYAQFAALAVERGFACRSV
jgi:hypothetical protein